MRGLLRTLLAVGLLATGGLLLAGGRATAADNPSPPPASVQLLSQTAWLQGPGVYSFRVGAPGEVPGDRVQVTVFYQVRTRTEFDDDAAGHVDGCCYYQRVAPLTSLSPAGSGFDIQLPVDQPAPAGDPFETLQLDETGVFPVQVALYDATGKPVGDPLTTFIVFAQKAASAGALKPLSAAVIIPVASRPVTTPAGGIGTPDSEEMGRLLQLAQVLNADSSVPASILASPLTLDGVAAGGSPTNRSVLDELNGATVGGPFEVLPSPYSPVSLGALEGTLPGEIEPQLQAGASTLKTVFGTAPDNRTWVIDGPLDGATLGVLLAHHVQQVIVPNGDLTPLPGEIQITFAGSTYLEYGGSQLRVISADNTLASDFTKDEPPVLAANQLLAELAMIYTEAPNATLPRGLAVLPPPGWSASPEFVRTLLNGLQGNPLVSAVTASQLFSSVGQPQGARYLSSAQLTPAPIDRSTDISNDRDKIDELKQVFGSSAQLTALQKELLLAESPVLSDRERTAVLDAIVHATSQVQHVASLPPATTITLTSTKGQIPLTILVAGNAHPKIQLHLRSQRLIFRRFSPKEGPCRVLTETQEICTLSLTNQNTTLKVPVETRSSGVFPLDVMLEVPGPTSAPPLQYERDTVRSTAVSGVAVIVIIVALVGLALWWGRDLRRGRRPKGLAPSPIDVSAGDPDVDGFFDQPPPDYGDGNGNGAAMSPSGAGAGPSDESDQNGQARETRKM